MSKSLNLRRNTRLYVLAGILLILIASLMLLNPNRSWGDVVFGPLFIIGGLIAITYINRLRIDKDKNELVHQTGALVPLRSKRYSLQKVRSVGLSQKTVRSNDDERTTFPIRLNGIKDSIILNHPNPWFSRVVAEQLARLLSVTLVNRVYGKATTREPSELDMPLVERWQRDDQRFERPSIKYDSDMQEFSQGTSYELSIRAEMPQLIYLVALLFLLVFPAVLDGPFADIFHSRGYRFMAVFFLVGGTMALALVGRSKLTITSEEVAFRQGYFPLKARLRIRDIEELVVAGDGITLIGDTKAVWVHWGRSKQDSDYLEAVVPYQIQRLGGHSTHDGRPG